MVVGACTITITLPGCHSLKAKRSVVRKLIERTQHRFNAAVAEVGHLNSHNHATIGIAVISNEKSHANTMLDKVRAFAGIATEAVVTGTQMELICIGSLHDDAAPLWLRSATQAKDKP